MFISNKVGFDNISIKIAVRLKYPYSEPIASF